MNYNNIINLLAVALLATTASTPVTFEQWLEDNNQALEEACEYAGFHDGIDDENSDIFILERWEGYLAVFNKTEDHCHWCGAARPANSVGWKVEGGKLSCLDCVLPF